MEKSFTQNDLILFAYNETDKTENEKLFESMKTNAELKENYKTILFMKYNVDSVLVSPEKRITNNIMNYSRALWAFQSHTSGSFNVLMN
ncbi:MAG: hypothetical protein DRJ05_08230 [Bacteroidetes bacterium]|nr:MAG: hypothetical protein DRJ05_08230 [Bacteroidota bacterium]